LQIIDEGMGKLDNPENSAPYLRLKARINALRVDSRFGFMFGGLGARDNMSEVLSRLFRIPVEGRPITIVDLSGVPSEILNVVVSVLSRMMFDFAVWSDRALPMLLVCEEAHRYVPQDTSLGFEPTKKSLARIAKEGRKYGVSLCVVSQRPSELATGILSQCKTIFALRMSNQKDQEFVRSALSESAMGLMEFLPSLRNAEAIAVGEGVPVPVRICFNELPEDRRPLSGTAQFSTAWQNDDEDKSFIDTVVERWRRQRR
jgi:DNA helicase HerA-like ATPase